MRVAVDVPVEIPETVRCDRLLAAEKPACPATT